MAASRSDGGTSRPPRPLGSDRLSANIVGDAVRACRPPCPNSGVPEDMRGTRQNAVDTGRRQGGSRNRSQCPIRGDVCEPFTLAVSRVLNLPSFLPCPRLELFTPHRSGRPRGVRRIPCEFAGHQGRRPLRHWCNALAFGFLRALRPRTLGQRGGIHANLGQRSSQFLTTSGRHRRPVRTRRSSPTA
jgi:hypothetical protein